MLKADVIEYFGSLTKIAEVCGITKQGVWMWPKVVPQGHAWHLQVLTAGALNVKPELYLKITRSKPKRPPASSKRRSSASSARAAK